MVRRSRVAAGAALVLVCAVAEKAGAATDRPNIVLIMADDMGRETVGAYGGTSYRTPNIDRLAAEGLRFEHAYATPLCTNTRIQLMTGKYNSRNWLAFGLLDPRERTFGHYLQDAGYDEYSLWHTGHTESKGSRYADPVIDQNGTILADTEGRYGFDIWVDHLSGFMTRNRDRPFFAY